MSKNKYFASNQFIFDFDRNLRSGNFWPHIEFKLEPVIRGLTVKDWFDRAGDELYLNYHKPRKKYVDLEPYYKPRRIERVVHNCELAVNARLVTGSSFFIIETKNPVASTNYFQRFLIAHEIAHTYLFNINSEKIKDLKVFQAGSKEIEYICNRMARAILLPNPLIKEQIARIEKPSDEKFSLNAINHLCQTCRVSHKVLLRRIIEDNNYWNCIVLRFKYFPNEQTPWKLVERFVPQSFWNNTKAFIPRENSKKEISDPSRYPAAKGNLNLVLNDTYRALLKAKRITNIFKKDELFGSPVIQLFNYLYSDDSLIKVHFSLGVDRPSNAKVLNLCIPI